MQTIILEKVPNIMSNIFYPVLRNGKLGIARDTLALEYSRYIKEEVKRQNISLLDSNSIGIKCVVETKGNANYKIDSLITIILKGLESVAYKYERNISEFSTSKKRFSENNRVIISFWEIKE